jgi:hypothetical protein
MQINIEIKCKAAGHNLFSIDKVRQIHMSAQERMIKRESGRDICKK